MESGGGDVIMEEKEEAKPPAGSMASKFLLSSSVQDPLSRIAENGALLSAKASSSGESPSASSSLVSISRAPKRKADDTEAEADHRHYTPLSEYSANLLTSSEQTGLCYDVRMRFHTTPDIFDSHPETPQRITEIYLLLQQSGLISHEPHGRHLREYLYRIDATEASRKEICLVHSEEYYKQVKSTQALSTQELCDLENTSNSVYFNKNTFLSSKLAAGGALNSCRAVLNSTVKNAIAVIRPPGHHAEEAEAQGFCIFNNVCVATRACQQEFPDICRKVLILDWDVHHGNGVQHVFYDDPNVLYISIHRWSRDADGTRFYPGESGDPEHCGVGPGLGRNVNIAWEQAHMKDADYMFAFQNVVMPIAYEFNPDLVIVAAGFDAADGDQLGQNHVSPACYSHMTHMLMSLAEGKIVVCLEGGYNLQAISTSAHAVTRVLMGEPPDRMILGSVATSAEEDVRKAISIQSKYWRCMNPPTTDSDWIDQAGGVPLGEIIRSYQAFTLYRELQLVKLMIFRDRPYSIFDNQVLATRNYATCKSLLLVFHDPPQVTGIRDPDTGSIDLSCTFMTDNLKSYITWAVKQGYGIIDVNIPVRTRASERQTRANNPQMEEAVKEELAVYLWQNYIEVGDHENIVFMGVGDAFHSLIHFINNHAQECMDLVSGVVGFITAETKLPSVIRDIDQLAMWYYKNSRIFVGNNHMVFDPDRKTPKKKFGTITQSKEKKMMAMLSFHETDATKWMESRLQSNDDLHSAPSVVTVITPTLSVSHAQSRGIDKDKSLSTNQPLLAPPLEMEI